MIQQQIAILASHNYDVECATVFSNEEERIGDAGR
jgi:hypothetical protein